jgi:D-3-phosphoglycerate dehydrogenase
MKKKILVVQPIHEKALALLDSRRDISYEVVTDLSEENLLRLVRSVDAITVRDAKLSPAVVEKAAAVKVISRHGIGYDNIPVADCTKRGIPVTVVGPVNAVAVAEHTLFLLLAAARVGVELDRAVRDGNFAARASTRSLELNGKSLLLVGFGQIGREVARRASALGMRIVVYDPYASDGVDVPVTLIGLLDEALKQAHAVSLHVPLTDQTRNILGKRELGLLPKGAIVVNASRGGLVDEDALAEAVSSGALHGAGLDTFDVEPLPVTSPLVANQRIVLSPHSAALTEEALIAMGMKTVENVLGVLDGQIDPNLVVNFKAIQEAQDAIK